MSNTNEEYIKLSIDVIRCLVNNGKIKWVSHIIDRMTQRDISRQDVLKCVLTGEIIEEYPSDYPYPSCLILNFINGNRHIHVVCATDTEYVYMITAYYPNNVEWLDDYKTRRSKK